MTIDIAGDKSRAGSYLTPIALVRLPWVFCAIAILWVLANRVLSDPFAISVTVTLETASVIGTYASTFRSVFRAFERMEFQAAVLVFDQSAATATVLLLLYFGFGLLEISFLFLANSVSALLLSMIITRKKFVWFD